MHVIPTPRPKVETFSVYYLTYIRNFKIKKTVLDSSRLGESNDTKYKKLF